ncbi:hypothetical protein ASG25_10635 [Rhizobium sp. Leaf384]|uniref:hypothetical protein n=1 Tax=Rhizobium sp. Leaf384 TaxID=1736358 RepID=UPI000714695F|nr:hypothetical protein [Rhizobium sp. Leaf384]KQS79034.1 hypothetical protein ASG25_10635 [Rhizobium sp. Leaf384]
MSLISVIDEVCDEVTIDRFDAIYGNPDPDALTMLDLAQQAGDEISRRADWQALLRTGTILASNVSLPSDFQRLTPGGGIRTSTGQFIRPVTNSGQWAVVSQMTPAQPYYFISSGKIRVAPASAAVSAIMDYLSKSWVQNGAAFKDRYSADDDTAVFPERLLMKNVVWRWRRQKGLAYDDQLAEFEADLVSEINADRGA